MRKRVKLLIFAYLIPFKLFAISGIDAKFRLDRAQFKVSSSVKSSSGGVSFYRSVLSKALSSSCDFFPSDSLKAQLDFKRCGSLYGVLSAAERLFKEPNAYKLGFKVVQIKHKNYFFDLPMHCKYFR